jgi:dienelactone hydrolase
LVSYCLGGTFVLELACDCAPIVGVVTFHDGLKPGASQTALTQVNDLLVTLFCRSQTRLNRAHTLHLQIA